MYLDLKYNISRDGKIKGNKDSYLGEYYKLKLLLKGYVKFVIIQKRNLNLLGFSYNTIKKKLLILIKLAKRKDIYILTDTTYYIFINKKYITVINYIDRIITNPSENIYKDDITACKYIYYIIYYMYTNKYLKSIKKYHKIIINFILYKYYLIKNIKREILIKYKNYHQLYRGVKDTIVYKNFLKIEKQIKMFSRDLERNNLLTKVIPTANNNYVYNSSTVLFNKKYIKSLINEINNKDLKKYLLNIFNLHFNYCKKK